MLPLSVWLCSDAVVAGTCGEAVGADRRSRVCDRHRQAVGRELARHLIDACTDPGESVVEAFTTSETVLTVAAEMRRRGVACVPHFPLAQHIGTRLRATLEKEQLARVQMRSCRPDQMRLGLADMAGAVDLLIAAPPAYETGGRQPKSSGQQDCPSCRADLWMLTHQQLAAFLTAAAGVLRPEGYLAIITTARYVGGRLIDPAPWIIRHCGEAGLRYIQHVIALRVPVGEDSLVVQAEPIDFAELRKADASVLPPVVSVHADVCLFVKVSRVGEAR